MASQFKKIAVPSVTALVDIVKAAQVERGVELVPFAYVRSGSAVSAMGCAAALKQVRVGWDGVMFKVVDDERTEFYDDTSIQTVLPIGRAALIPML